MSKKKAGGRIAQHVRPSGKRLGVKVTSGEKVVGGMVLVRQRGTRFKAGRGVRVGRDYTLYATANGLVRFSQKFGKKIVSVVSS